MNVKELDDKTLAFLTYATESEWESMRKSSDFSQDFIDFGEELMKKLKEEYTSRGMHYTRFYPY